MKINTIFKTLIDINGNYRGISHDGYGGGKGKNRLYKSSVPSLMGMKVTIDRLKNCYPNVDFDKLELITVEIHK
tara:strand:- start:8446 stop:8667 length:222 start_codon:yes stop_codon:yes gene_type:complete